jgi:cellulose synthase/poly-beta-1,6-N-acetylglucosamine synthase-like glycosyltransferase
MDTRSEEFPYVPGNSLSEGTTNIHVSALDGLINVNSLFTLAVFVGLTITTPGAATLVDDSACIAGEDIARNLLTFQVVSFSSFLFSSLVAQGLKQAILLINSKTLHDVFKAPINKHFLRFGMLLSAFGSVFGCIFLMLALMDVIQIKLGTLSCGSIWSIRAVVPLFMLVPTALIIYIYIVLYAFFH